MSGKTNGNHIHTTVRQPHSHYCKTTPIQNLQFSAQYLYRMHLTLCVIIKQK